LINATAYTGDLILYTETYEDMETKFFILAEFCESAKTKANGKSSFCPRRFIWSENGTGTQAVLPPH
jgi:hypothetical protein